MVKRKAEVEEKLRGFTQVEFAETLRECGVKAPQADLVLACKKIKEKAMSSLGLS
ncbi:hypothetical protein MUP77_14315 [Candidatus Bathyarchaeota archaeon]|nr:hypothetical protein [Candidatus Bathyarchaeota archaeon]